ncbi:MAG: hypothetical protein JWP89_5539 [Schlesneria sp.]|nr:hypothetical protein [Schlesneria sp.]
MREFFHGWRRKAGCVALVIALAMFELWMRSGLIEDRFLWNTNGLCHLFNSESGGVSWTAYNSWKTTTKGSFFGDTWWQSKVIDADMCHGWWQYKNECETHWEIQSLGFCFGSATKTWPGNDTRADYWLIPYWSLIIPLTLLSAYLILWKPRKRKTSAPPTNLNLVSN